MGLDDFFFSSKLLPDFSRCLPEILMALQTAGFVDPVERRFARDESSSNPGVWAGTGAR
jgi:hypothetical protein